MKLYIFSGFLFVFSTIFALSQEKLDHTSISFNDDDAFILSLSEILKQDYKAYQVKKALQPFKENSSGFLATSKSELFICPTIFWDSKKSKKNNVIDLVFMNWP